MAITSGLFRRRASFFAITAAIAAAACTGFIEAPGGSDGSSSAKPGPGTEPGVVNTAYPLTAVRTLTRAQYENSVRHLLGAEVPLPESLPGDPAVADGFELTGIGTSKHKLTNLAVRQYEGAALELAEYMFADASRREAFVGCSPSSATDACVDSFLTSFGRRVFRRALSPEELTRFAGIAVAGEKSLDVWEGLSFATAALLQSPHFLYRVELGETDPNDNSRLRLSPAALASRLSFLLWNSPPDDALLDSAESGALSDPEELESQTARLLASPKATESLGAFLDEWLGLNDLDGLGKDSSVFPEFTPSLAQAMKVEAQMVLRNLATSDVSFLDLFTTRQTYVNAELAGVYGLSGNFGSAHSAANLPTTGQRAGFLTMGAFLATNARATRTSPTMRGTFIMERLLCEHIAPPPPGVEANPPSAQGSDYQTMRDWLEGKHQNEPVCASCHEQMDPPGFALEHFDGMGSFRETDYGLTIDATGAFGDVSYDGALELGEVLNADPRTAACVVTMLFRHALGQDAKDEQQWLVSALTASFQQGAHRFEPLVRALVRSEAFRYSGGNR